MLRMALLAIVLLQLGGCGDDSDSGHTVAQGVNLILDSTHGDGGAAWGLPVCDACHLVEQIHAGASEPISTMTIDKGYDSCSGCHGSNGSSEPRQCLLCHNGVDMPASPHLDGSLSHNFSTNSLGGMVDADCLVCHVASDMDGSFELGRDFTPIADAMQLYPPYGSEADFCTRCHNRDHQQPGFEMVTDYNDPLISIEDSYRYVDQHGEVDGTGTRTFAGLRDGYRYQSEVKCSDCHAMHGTGNETGNKGLIIDSSAKGASRLDLTLPELAAHPYDVVTGEGEYSQLCVLCHQMEMILDDGAVDAGNGLAGVHEVGSDCRACHSHGE
ncbi:MAG: hypothetical protein GQ470_00930, partial [Gammaproteobacteria bacterium]|nr:hypothetical protein [Gammaproteobacteria bacterium]